MNEDIAPLARSTHTISIAKMDAVIQTLKKEGVREAVMAGRVEHRKLFSDLIPDMRAAQLLLRVKDRRADSILKAVAEEFQKDGIALVPTTTFLSHLIPQPGVLTRRKPSDTEQKNIEFGMKMAMGLSSLDLGQTVVVSKKTVLAIEAIEGTDECIRRAAQWGGENVVIVKSAKPNQDLRFDVPIVGITTIQVMKEVRAAVLAVEAGRTLMLEKDLCVETANRNNIVIVAWKRE